jgi:hypothetical protein
MARAATADELAKLRADGQSTRLFLAIHNPATVFTARVNAAALVTDMLTAIPYDGAGGDYTTVLPGQTLWIGSTAGAYDRGVARVRAVTDTVITVGETSEIPLADNDYLTVVDEFGLWPRHLKQTGTSWAMDYDVTYSDQHAALDPVPVLGPGVAVLKLTGATVEFAPTAAASWVLGSSVTGYSWACATASALSGADTATPTITLDAAGWHRVGCTVTAANGKTATGYRWVYVYDRAHLPASEFVLSECAGEAEAGGWHFALTLYAGAELAAVRDRALVVLFAEESYGGVAGSIGPLSGYENVIALGWIDGESIAWQGGGQGQASFTVQGPAHWLKQISGYPVGLLDTTAAPADWLHVQALSTDKALWHFLHWRATASTVLDFTLSGATTRMSAAEGAAGSLWAQLEAIGAGVLARPRCDRYGRLFVETDAQYRPTAERAAIPTVLAITPGDWRLADGEGVTLERRTRARVGLLDISGVSWDGTVATPIFARAPGAVMRRYGAIASRDRLLFADQTAANVLSGLLLAAENNPNPLVTLPLAANNRLIDIAPAQYVTLSLAATDTPRGVVWTAQKLLPRRVSYQHDPEHGALLVELEAEGETSGPAGVTVTPPSNQPQNSNVVIETPGIPTYPLIPPGNTWFPPLVPNPPGVEPTGCTALDAGANGPWLAAPEHYFLTTEDPAVLETLVPYPATIRSGAAANGSYMDIEGVIEKKVLGAWVEDNSMGAWEVHLVGSGGGSLLVGQNFYAGPYGNRKTRFSPSGAMDVAGFKIVLNGPGSTDAAEFALYHTFESGDYGWEFIDGGGAVPAEGRGSDGCLQVRSTTDWWSNSVWRYTFPEPIYITEDSHVLYSQKDIHGFPRFGMTYLDGGGNPQWTAGSTGTEGLYVWNLDDSLTGLPVVSMEWQMDHGGTEWTSLEFVHLFNFIGSVAARRFRITDVKLYNICPLGA